MAHLTVQWRSVCLIAALIMLLVTPTSVASRGIRGHGRKLKAMFPASCASYLPAGMAGFEEGFTVLLTADPGTFSGQAEARHFVYNIKNFTIKPVDETVCGSFYQGHLVGSPVVVSTTGIGPGPAALCTQEILQACGDVIKEIIYFGTSGFSTMPGGLLDPSRSCTAANPETRIVRLGDVCVTPFSMNWNCKLANWHDQSKGYPNECFRPLEDNGPDASYLYGECEFYNMNMDHRNSDLQLAREVRAAGLAAVAKGNMASRSAELLAYEREYWAITDQGAKLPNKTIDSVPPTQWKPTECIEVDSQFFWSGTPWDVTARDYSAQTINLAFNYTGSKMLTSLDVIAVSAMEGVGAGQAMLKYDALKSSQGRHIPYTNVRTASDYLYQPVTQTSTGNWEVYQAPSYDFSLGYAYAIATGATSILQLLATRCEKAGGNSCTYTLQPS